ncbi:MAG: hypothetical protein PHZ03_04035 [Syntrophomonas sp.]|nr:hypothetical protein [Syntrophomonas sp.]
MASVRMHRWYPEGANIRRTRNLNSDHREHQEYPKGEGCLMDLKERGDLRIRERIGLDN